MAKDLTRPNAPRPLQDCKALAAKFRIIGMWLSGVPG
jgi:hypothetical protein